LGKEDVMSERVYDRDDVVVEAPSRRHPLLRLFVALLVFAAIVVVALVLFVNGTSSKSAANDVTITACRPATGDKPTAAGTILNHSSKTSNYLIRLKFTDAQGNTLSEGVAPVASVGSGETARWDVTGTRDANGPVQCAITGVSRTHIPGQ
jgi:hypothetical protein